MASGGQDERAADGGRVCLFVFVRAYVCWAQAIVGRNSNAAIEVDPLIAQDSPKMLRLAADPGASRGNIPGGVTPLFLAS